MSNVNTDHSRQLRQNTAKAWNKKLTAANKIEIRSKDAAAIAAIKEGLRQIPGATNTEKILLLISSYENNQKNKKKCLHYNHDYNIIHTWAGDKASHTTE